MVRETQCKAQQGSWGPDGGFTVQQWKVSLMVPEVDQRVVRNSRMTRWYSCWTTETRFLRGEDKKQELSESRKA